MKTRHGKTRKLWALMLATVLALSACAPAPAPSANPANSGTPQPGASSGEKIITMAMIDPWTSFFPFAGGGGARNTAVQSLIFDALATTLNDGTVMPRLAKSWDVSEDGRTFTFHLNENAKWHDGENVTAHDVEWTYKTCSDPNANVTQRSTLRYYEGTNDDGSSVTPGSIAVKALDDYTVEMTLKAPTSDSTLFAITLGEVVLPKHLLENVPVESLETDEFWRNPIGSGPLKFTSMIDGERIEFDANKDYFLGAPEFDKFVVRVVPSSGLLAGLMSGDIDILAGGQIGVLPLADFRMAQEEANLVTENVSSYTYQYVSLNNSSPLLSDVRVRKAIDMAIDKQRIVDELLGGYGKVACMPWAVNHPYFKEGLTVNKYDVEGAKALLREAGWDESVTMTLGVPANNSFRESAALLVQQDLEKVGIKTTIRQYDSAALFDALTSGSIELGMVGSAGSVDPNEPCNLFNPSGAWCFGCLPDNRYWDLFTEGLAYTSFNDRKAVYDQLQTMIDEEVPYSYLCNPDILMTYNSRISNVRLVDFGITYPVWEWKIA